MNPATNMGWGQPQGQGPGSVGPCIPQNSQHQQQQLSVVATVWGGVTSGTQSGPMATQAYSTGGGGHHHHPHSGNNGSYCSTNNVSGSGYNNVMTGNANHMMGQTTGQGMTTKASYGMPSSGIMGPTSMSNYGPMTGTGRGRPAPYPNHQQQQQYMSQKRGGYSSNTMNTPVRNTMNGPTSYGSNMTSGMQNTMNGQMSGYQQQQQHNSYPANTSQFNGQAVQYKSGQQGYSSNPSSVSMGNTMNGPSSYGNNMGNSMGSGMQSTPNGQMTGQYQQHNSYSATPSQFNGQAVQPKSGPGMTTSGGYAMNGPVHSGNTYPSRGVTGGPVGVRGQTHGNYQGNMTGGGGGYNSNNYSSQQQASSFDHQSSSGYTVGNNVASQQQQQQQMQHFPQQQLPQQQPPPQPTQGQQQQGMHGHNMQSHYNNNNGRSFHQHQHSPIPGNPTPPLTPASSIVSYGPDVKPFVPSVAPDVKPHFSPKDDELRLTFPVKDGIILSPFRLEHNLVVSNHVFMLKPSVYQTLMTRPDLELQLKCFHHEDRSTSTNWPQSVQVSVNSTPLVIDRGSQKPLYLKNVCQPDRNIIQITVSACCCSHLFLLHLVHRPTVKSVLQSLLRKRLLMADACIDKIKRHFSSTAFTGNALPGGPTGNDVEQTAVTISLKCPITQQRMNLPARGPECKHIPCFDLESYLALNADRGHWRCPICKNLAIVEGLEVDQYIWGILNNTRDSDVDEVTIDSKANWTVSTPLKPGMKQEMMRMKDCSSTSRRFKATSPNSTSLPTSNSWEVNQGLSPYAPLPPSLPDIQSICPPNGHSSLPHSKTGYHANGYGHNSNNSSSSSAPFDFHSPASDFTPLSHPPSSNESLNPLDPLAAMEKSLSQHEQQMNSSFSSVSSDTSNNRSPGSSRVSSHSMNIKSESPGHSSHPPPTSSSYPSTHVPSSTASHVTPSHGPGTPHVGPKTPQTPAPHTPLTPGTSVAGTSSLASTPSVGVTESSHNVNPNNNQSTSSSNNSLSSDLNDLNFDPAAVIDGEGQGQEALNVSLS